MNDRERLWNYYFAGRLKNPRPRYLCFNATLRCDGKCGHCGIWKDSDKGEEIGSADLEKALANPFFSKVETAWITGGEPTVRSDLREVSEVMVRFLPSLKTLGIATNGLNPERVIDRIKAMAGAIKAPGQGLFAHISLDGTGEVHDRVRNRPGAFEAVQGTLGRLRDFADSHPEAKLEIGLNCVIQPGNVEGLDDLHDFARDRGLQITFNVALVTDQVYRNADRADELSLSAEQKKKVKDFLARIAPESPRPFRYQYRIIDKVLSGERRPARCLTLYTTVNINADGTLIPCPASSERFKRNAVVEDMDALWDSDDAAAMRSAVEREMCPGCMLSCSLGDSMPLSEWLKGGWDREPAGLRAAVASLAEKILP